MANRILISGAGIGGLSAALACARAGTEVQLFERSAELAEVGAGIQLGPNVTRLLRGWGLDAALSRVAACPDALQVRSAVSGGELARLPLGPHAVQKYGAPYLALHRADLQALLLDALKHQGGAQLHLGRPLADFEQGDQGVVLRTATGLEVQGDLLIGADGLWSLVRSQLLNDTPPRATGHLAYRALVPQASLPQRLRSRSVSVWLGPRLHVVQYPVRGGDWLNVVAIVQGQVSDGSMVNAQIWDHAANARELSQSFAGTCAPLQNLIQAVDSWRLWPLSVRAPVRGAREMARGRVALLGDAAHPMLPYLAQGAGMAIEDADEMAACLIVNSADVPMALENYAARRWRRNARVQARSLRNGRIFHASGPLRVARDASLKVLGKRLLDLPWLYRGPA